jgi:hypothetical protein
VLDDELQIHLAARIDELERGVLLLVVASSHRRSRRAVLVDPVVTLRLD